MGEDSTFNGGPLSARSPRSGKPDAVPQIPGFRDLERIGQGGFSTVYSATQDGIERRVAVKILDLGVSDEDRFLRECRTLGALSEVDGIVSILQATFTTQGQPCIVMQLMSGGSLADRLRLGGPLDPTSVIESGARLSSALQIAHDQGVFHRDIKPENVLFDSRGKASIADFGIALIDGVAARSQTIESISPPHAPPERFSGTPADPVRGDVYSLASTLYTALAGRPPFGTAADGGLAGLISRVTSAPVPALNAPTVDPSLVAVLALAMSKDPSQRQSSMAELRNDLLAPPEDLTIARASQAESQMVTGAPNSFGVASPQPNETLLRSSGQLPPGYVGGQSHPYVDPYDENFGRTEQKRSRTGLLIALGAIVGLIIAVGSTLGFLKLADENSETSAAGRSSARIVEEPRTVESSTSMPSPSTTAMPVDSAEPADPAVDSASSLPTARGKSASPTTVPQPTTPLPVSEATTAVDVYLESASSKDMEYFIERWSFPIELYYSESKRNVDEATVRAASATYWDKFDDLSFYRKGPTKVVARDAGWDTSTDYVAELWFKDGTYDCQQNRINIGYNTRWQVRTITENSGPKC